MPKTTTRFSLKASVLACALAAAPFMAQAAGIGKLTVLSALGQPLRAEIELSATRDELSSLNAKLATQEQFRQQGMEFTAAVAALNFSIEKRANGQPYVRVTTDRPLNEPFLDILVELAWASGRLTREYTFLLDPIELPRPTGSAVVTPGVNPISSSSAPAVTESSKPAKAGKPAKSASAKPAPAPKAEPAPAPKSEPAPRAEPAPKTEGGATREVKRGDTLGKIASETAPEGISLDQMLVALYSSNRDAFIGDNLNRLKTGKILNIPDREAAAAVSEPEARKTVSMHAQNFNAYRNQLAEAAAAGTPAEAPPAQAASGKITPKVEDKAPAPVAGKDKLEVSKSEGGKDAAAKASKAAAAAEEDRVAKEKALKEAEARVAALEKNVADLKKLNEIKSQALAEAEKKASAAKGEPAKPVEPPKVAEAPKPVEPPKVEEKPAETPMPVPAPAPAVEPPPAEKPVEAAPPPPPPKKRVVLPPPPEPEPTFMEEFGPFVYLGGALVALLGGFFGFREYKRRKDMDASTGSQFDEASSTSSVFGTTGGQSVDTNNVSLASGFSQTSLTGNEGTAGVDPVAEAEVYMAYGRDAQAEEILLEAIKAEPTRQAVHLKLLELYAARKSVKPFEEVAKDLKEQTGGTGPNWDRAAALGKGIDPANPLYGDAGSVTDTVSMGAFGTSTVIMPPGQLAKMAAMDPAKAETVVLPGEDVAEEVAPPSAVPAEEHSFDLDLGDEPASVMMPEPEQPVTLDFDLDLGAGTAQSSADEPAVLDLEVPSISPAEAPAAPSMDIEFDLDLPQTAAPVPAPAPAAPEAPAPAAGNSVDFDFNLDTPATSAPAPGAIAPAVDFSDISLDLDAPAEAAPAAAAPVASAAAVEEDNPEVSTKLELAQAYEEMGDIEGMRELLQEVLSEGSSSQQDSARSKLAQHGF